MPMEWDTFPLCKGALVQPDWFHTICATVSPIDNGIQTLLYSTKIMARVQSSCYFMVSCFRLH